MRQPQGALVAAVVMLTAPSALAFQVRTPHMM
jgi:hypothetical protein